MTTAEGTRNHIPLSPFFGTSSNSGTLSNQANDAETCMDTGGFFRGGLEGCPYHSPLYTGFPALTVQNRMHCTKESHPRFEVVL
jgi:hypothetical protein